MAKTLKGLVESRNEKVQETDTIFAALDERVKAWKDAPEETRGDKPELSPEDFETVEKRTQEIDDLDDRIKEETKKERKRKLISEARALIVDAVPVKDDVTVVAEPMMYGPGSDHSYYADLMRTAHGTLMPGSAQARQRLNTWEHQVEREISHDSEIGKKAVESLRTHYRGNDAESAEFTRKAIAEVRDRGKVSLEMKQEQRINDQGVVETRSIVTGGGATATAASGGAAFVSPAIFLDPYAPWREAGREFADQCNKQTLPDYGRLQFASL